MKKLISLVLLSSALFAGQTVVPQGINQRINTDDVAYRYHFQKKTCERFDYDLRATVVRMFRSNNIIIENYYENSAGIILETSYQDRDTVYEMVLADTYGACMLYKDVVIDSKKIKAEDIKNVYAKMRLR